MDRQWHENVDGNLIFISHFQTMEMPWNLQRWYGHGSRSWDILNYWKIF